MYDKNSTSLRCYFCYYIFKLIPAKKVRGVAGP